MSILTTFDLDRLVSKAPQIVYSVPGQLTVTDRMIYYWATRDYYTGKGTIVDAGALVGSTAAILGEGLLANEKADLSKSAIYSYDLFEDTSDGYMASIIKQWYPEDEQRTDVFDFLHYFKKNTEKYSQYITSIKGDIFQQTYTMDENIEILSIDIAKSPELMLHCAKIFFPKLIPNHSLIIHQDYIFSFNPWIQIAMDMMSDFMEKVYDAPDHCTSVFICRKNITEHDVENVLGKAASDYYHTENAKHLHNVIESTQSNFGRLVHAMALSYFYFQLGEERNAINVGNRSITEFNPTAATIETAGLGWFMRDYLKIDHPCLNKP